MTESDNRILPLGAVQFDRDTGQLLDQSGMQVALSYRATSILSTLVTHAGEAVGKEGLIASTGGEATATDEALIESIGELRKAIGDQAQIMIETVPGIGYRLNTDVPARAQRNGNALKYMGLAVALFPIILILVAIISGFIG